MIESHWLHFQRRLEENSDGDLKPAPGYRLKGCLVIAWLELKVSLVRLAEGRMQLQLDSLHDTVPVLFWIALHAVDRQKAHKRSPLVVERPAARIFLVLALLKLFIAIANDKLEI